MMHSRCHFIGRRVSTCALLVLLGGVWGCGAQSVEGVAEADELPSTVAETPTSAAVSAGEATAAAPAQMSDAASAEPQDDLARAVVEDVLGEAPEELGREMQDAMERGAATARKLLGQFQLTYYWMAHERSARGKRNMRIYDPQCEPLARVSREFAMRLSLEGTGTLRDGRVINVSGPCACDHSPCFFVLEDEEQRFGVGVLERPLSPFRSVAVDPSFVSIGTKLYIPELDGLTMPGKPPWGGFVHDGCVVADDRGGGVEGKQIDFFMARKPFYQAFHRRHRLTQITVYSGARRCEGEREVAVVAADRNSI